jgi:hypothetical protein
MFSRYKLKLWKGRSWVLRRLSQVSNIFANFKQGANPTTFEFTTRAFFMVKENIFVFKAN